jgi:CheY-like chemotaxis protein
MWQEKTRDEVSVHDCAGIDVLIVDDEPIVRRLLELALRHSGLRIASSVNGAEALRLYQEHRGDVRLLVLDVQMPELDGPQTFEALRALDPDVRVLFMSGGCRDYTVEDLLASGALGFIEKPFRNLHEIAERLRRLALVPVAQAS